MTRGAAALYVGGNFTNASGVSALRIARWNGSSWSAVGGGMNDEVDALAVWDDGDGPALYATGLFTMAGGESANRVAKWNGSEWSAVGSGLNAQGLALRAFDDEFGSALYAGGLFTTAGGVTVNRLAKWDGATWSALGEGMGGIVGGTLAVRSLTVFDEDGGGPGAAGLYIGGNFTTADGIPSGRIARLGCGGGPPCEGPTITEHPASQTVCEGGSVTFSVTATGTPTLIYQWRKDGEDIPDAVAATHTIDAVTPGDAGRYDVVVTNPCGQATSDSAELTVGPPVPGDVDGDCDVDLDDHEWFYGCLAGPGVTEPPQGCSPEQFTRSDLDLDDDVDLGDFLSFQQNLADR